MTAAVENIIQAVRPDVIQLTLPAQSNYLTIIRRIVKAISKLLSFDSQGIADLKNAIGEACLNVIQHAYPEGRRRLMREDLTIRFLIYPTKLEVVVKDMGCGFDPVFVERYVSRKDVDSPERMKLGLFVIQKAADEIEIDSRIGKGTQIRITKYLPAVEHSSGNSSSEGK